MFAPDQYDSGRLPHPHASSVPRFIDRLPSLPPPFVTHLAASIASLANPGFAKTKLNTLGSLPAATRLRCPSPPFSPKFHPGAHLGSP